MQSSSIFKVYNASAGSGKTHTIAKEYLKIVLISNDIYTFQKVLAITFTNKAAAEMKERVLQNLELFATGTKNDIAIAIMDETDLDWQSIQQKSEKILDAILQNYGAFAITTIDSFTHQLIKTFAYDLKLPLTFEVEMDSDLLLNQAIDLLMSQIGTHPKLTKVMVAYVLTLVDDYKSWDIQKNLAVFAKRLLNEDDAQPLSELGEKSLDDFEDFKKNLSITVKDLEKEIKMVANSFLELLVKEGLVVEDFYGKGKIPNFFKSISQEGFQFKFFSKYQTIEKAIENKQYYTKTTKPTIAAKIDGLSTEIEKSYQQVKSIFNTCMLCELLQKSLVPVSVLNLINKELQSVKNKKNVLLIAEFNKKISESIANQPAPFIYERLGQKFTHYFVDEMQDTSTLQWQNLKPLINNALAQENTSLLLVGDAKQSIYRWRGGKAQQFIDLGLNNYNPFTTTKKVETLETNYRSFSEIIEFNNLFFKHVAPFFSDETYQKLYEKETKQKINSKVGGYVSIEFVDKKSLDTDETTDVDKDSIIPQKVYEKIQQVQQQFLLNEICVLVRTKVQGIAVANYLAQNNIKVLSSETLLISQNQEVNFIISFLQYFVNENDDEAKLSMLQFLHQQLQHKTPKHDFIEANIRNNGVLFYESLNKYGFKFEIHHFLALSFYDKIEEIIRCFQLATTSNAHVTFFVDVVLEKHKKGFDVTDFLEFWELKKDTLSIVSTPTENAVQIMTIHKSKGLQFPVVIVPFDLNLYYQRDVYVWHNQLPKQFEFQQFLLPSTKNLSFSGDYGNQLYLENKSKLELDNFNIIYVAYTRAVEQLHIITENRGINKTTKDYPTNSISGILIKFLQAQNKWNSDISFYEFGSSKRMSKPNSSLSNSDILDVFIFESWQTKNIQIVANSERLWDDKVAQSIKFGNSIHQILAQVSDVDQVDAVLKNAYYSGYFTIDEMSKIKDTVLKIINHPELKSYFLNANFINERELMDENGAIYIPDKLINTKNGMVILDYKTGEKLPKHKSQLLNYENNLQKLGYQIDKKVLVYSNDEIEIETF